MAAPDQKHVPVCPRRASAFRVPLRRRKVATVQLGRRQGWACRLAGALQRIGQVAPSRRALKQLRAFYSGLTRDLNGGAAPIEAIRSRLLIEAYFAVPLMPAVQPSHW